ncbi:MAG TPA: DUF1552 domain-containing protein [Polyangiaceae bacterium]
MKLSAHKKLTRRDLVRALGTAALFLPGLELFERSARAAAPGRVSKYIVFCYTPDGVNQSAFWPTGTTANYQLSPILKPLEKYKDKLLILGPQMNGTSLVANTGLSYFAPVAQHQAPVTLTARAGHTCTGQFCVGNLGLPYLSNQLTAVNRLDAGPSIDQLIAKAVGTNTDFSSLNFGLHPRGGDTPSDINYRDDGTPLTRLATADEAWTHMFGRATGTPTTPSMTPLNKHDAVTEFLHSRFSELRGVVSTNDQRLLDSHLAALEVYEARARRRLTDATTGDPTNPACSMPTRRMVATDETSVRTGADTETLCPFFLDMIATAFQCELTKVTSLSFGYPGGGDAGGLRMPWLGFTDPLHFVSHHGGDATKLDKYQKMSAWIASQIAALMDRLNAIPSATGAGTLLDETTIYWFNRHGDGDSHANFALPNVILGGTGGYFEMGRWLQMPRTNPTKVLISLANAMGVNVPTFGEQGLSDTSPLSGLTA